MFLTFFMMVKAAFQSTLPHGSDRGHCRISDPTAQFQSTFPHGSDLVIIYSVPRRWNFNPRSLTGATYIWVLITTLGKISIHAPLRERPRSRIIPISYTDFNPRSLTGATHEVLMIIMDNVDFNPRSLTGATLRSMFRLPFG